MKGEFGLLFENEDRELLLKDAENSIRNIMETFKNKKIIKDNLFIYVEIDIGAALGNAGQISSILSRADQIKIDTQKINGNRKQFAIESDIRDRFIADQTNYDIVLSNITDHTMRVFFQPVINLKNGENIFYEALLRLTDRKKKLVSVYPFLDTAKKTGLYPKLTLFVLNEVFSRIKSTERHTFSVNLSLNDIENDTIIDFLYSMNDVISENKERIIFEITESEISTNFDKMKHFLQYAKDLDLRIAIDDFGTGYSNFMRFADFPPYICKIDGKLFQKAFKELYSSRMLAGIVRMCNNLEIRTVAEYIESEEQQEYAMRLKIDYGQGYHFKKPGPEL